MNTASENPTTPIVMATDRGEVSWTPVTEHLDPRKHDLSDLICDGHLFGPEELTDEVRFMLSEFGPDTTDITYWCTYTFTEGRDTLADIVAALVSTGRGRGLLNDAGWGVLTAAIPELAEDGDEEDEVFSVDEDGHQILDLQPGEIIY